MTQATVQEGLTPSQEIIQANNKTTVITDSLGRKITIKKPSALAELRLVDALGDSAKNEIYFMMVSPVIFVVNIDGEPFLSPNSKAEVEILFDRLGREGAAAVMANYKENFAESDSDSFAEKAKKKPDQTS